MYAIESLDSIKAKLLKTLPPLYSSIEVHAGHRHVKCALHGADKHSVCTAVCGGRYSPMVNRDFVPVL